jgi:hypothetical protein
MLRLPKMPSYSYFIEVLQTMLKLFKPKAHSRTMSESQNCLSTATSIIGEDDLHNTTNRFAFPEIEGPRDDESEIPPAANATKSSNAKANVPISIEVKLATKGENLPLGCFCLLQDLNNIRTYLQGLW